MVRGGRGLPAYATAKAAVHGLTRTMARDLGKHRIRVNAVVPGWIMTERQKTLWVKPDTIEAHRNRQCLPDLIEPVYVARMVLFLARTMPHVHGEQLHGGSRVNLTGSQWPHGACGPVHRSCRRDCRELVGARGFEPPTPCSEAGALPDCATLRPMRGG